MNIFTKSVKRIALSLAGISTLLILAPKVASAIVYNGDDTVASPIPAFNVFTGVPSWGNEPDFLRARAPMGGNENDPDTQYVDPLNTNCVDGKKIQMKVYVHNGASVAGNKGGSGPSVAHGTRVRVSIPGTQGVKFVPNATISATNAATDTDTVTITCANGMQVKLQYIPGSASSFSLGTGVVHLSDSIVTTGVPIRSQSVQGDVWGCWNDRVYVVLSVKIVKVEQPKIPPACTALEVTKLGGREIQVNSIGFTAGDATVSGVELNFGDGNVQTIPSSQLPLTQPIKHTYAKDGTFHITATVKTSVGNKTSASCQKDVTVTTTTPPEKPPKKPTVLVSTGVSGGSMAGIFVGTSLLGTFLHRKWSLLKANR